MRRVTGKQLDELCTQMEYSFSFPFFNILNDLNIHDLTGSICADKIITLKEKDES